MTNETTASERERLLPCPFCGHATAPKIWDSEEAAGDMWDSSNPLSFQVVCDASAPNGGGGCGSAGGFESTEIEAVATWNTRAALPATADQPPSTDAPAGVCLPRGLPFDAFGEPRVRYVRVTLDGSHMVDTPKAAEQFVQDAKDAGDESVYTLTDVYLSEREFDDLPEFDGF